MTRNVPPQTSCAICTSTRGPHTPQPLGRNNALVPVCAACDEPIFARQGPERGYAGGAGPSGVDYVVMTKAMRKLMGDAEYERLNRIEDEHSRRGAHALDEGDLQWRQFVRENYSTHRAQRAQNGTAADRRRARPR